VYPDVGLKKARDRRDEMRRLVADGIDPSAARKQEKLMALDAALNTFEAVAREWFEKHSPNWEASRGRRTSARLFSEAGNSEFSRLRAAWGQLRNTNGLSDRLPPTLPPTMPSCQWTCLATDGCG
jgi:hypothetical protein